MNIANAILPPPPFVFSLYITPATPLHLLPLHLLLK